MLYNASSKENKEKMRAGGKKLETLYIKILYVNIWVIGFRYTRFHFREAQLGPKKHRTTYISPDVYSLMLLNADTVVTKACSLNQLVVQAYWQGFRLID